MKHLPATFLLVLLSLVCPHYSFADTAKLSETDSLFAAASQLGGYGNALRQFAAQDAVVLNPMPAKVDEYVSKLPQSYAAISFKRVVAETSNNAILGFTMGNWKTNTGDSSGQYLIIWQRDQKNNYRIAAVALSPNSSGVLGTRNGSASRQNPENKERISAADEASSFFGTAEKLGYEQAYKSVVNDDSVVLREGRGPFRGKKAILGEMKGRKGIARFGRQSIFTSSGDMAFIVNSFKLTDRNGIQTESGHFVQVWRFNGKNWLIAADSSLSSK